MVRILNHGNRRCLPYLNIDVWISLYQERNQSETNVDAQEKYNAKNQDVATLIELSVMNEVLPEI
jgi:hypothetical protein